MKTIQLKEISDAAWQGKLNLPFFSTEKYSQCQRWLGNASIDVPLLGAAAYLAYQSCLFYLTDGNKGADLLPIGPEAANKILGGPASFAMNFSFNFYFLCLTGILLRESYLSIQLKKELTIPTHLARKIGLSIFATVYAASTGYIFFSLSNVEKSLSNQVITATVSAVLNLFGAYELGESIIKFIHHLCCGKSDNQTTKQLLQQIANNVEAKQQQPTKSCIKKRKKTINNNDDIENNSSELNTKESTTPLMENNQEEKFFQFLSKQNSETLEKKCCDNFWLRLVIHAFPQVCNAMSLYGYYFDTANSLEKKNLTGAGKHIASALIFLPYFILNAAIAKKNTDSIVDGLTSKKTWENLRAANKPLLLLKVLFFLINFYLTYQSSTTSLQLNRQYGLTALWSRILTCLGCLLSNGFGAQQIFDSALDHVSQLCLFTTEDRQYIHRGKKVVSFLHDMPDDVDINCSGLNINN